MVEPIPTGSAPDPDARNILRAMAAPEGAPPQPLRPGAPRVRGEGLLRALERGFLHLDRFLGRALPEPLNPFLHTGAVAVTSLLVALVTGVLLLFWYAPSVHQAYASVAAMSEAPFTAGFLRSLHRYSSDACMFFALVHALRLFLARRFAGARWLAWVTGVAMVGTLWLVGWTGYWLVWDERAQHVAVGTARLLDVVPIFTDPMSRAFLVDEKVNTFLFFVVFFVHMLLPLAMGIGLWLHLARISRARFLTTAPLTVWVLAWLCVLGALWPADNAGPARMATIAQSFEMDWWYLLPLVLTDRLTGGALWGVTLAGGAALAAIPWALARRQPPAAAVTPNKCNACEQCYSDCPYNAISMVPRSDGSRTFDRQAHVNPAACVACGICAGSCKTAGVGVDWFGVREQRAVLARWLLAAAEESEKVHVAFVCAESAGAGLRVDPATGRCPELPGYRVVVVPCAGWVHTLGLEHSLRYGARGALVVSCGPGDCHYREGATWTQDRIGGRREPILRTEQVPRERVRLLALDRTRTRDLVAAAEAFRTGGAPPSPGRPARPLAGLAAVALAAVLASLVGLVSDLGYATPHGGGSELVVTFKHPGQVSEHCRELTDDEKARRPIHMQREKICDRARAPVRLRVDLDGRPVVERSYPPKGVWGDLNSVAVEVIPVAPGAHRVGVTVGDGPDPDEWSHAGEQALEFAEGERRVVVFDRLAGFTFH